MTGTEVSGKRIVVGVDGSEPSLAALEWAVGQAELAGGTVEAVMSWEWPGSAAWSGLVPTAPSDENLEEAARNTLLESVERTLGAHPPVEIRTVLQPGPAAQVLLENAEGASLLVVGSRGLGGFKGALLGSVSRHVTLHAPCTVVVVRGGAAT